MTRQENPKPLRNGVFFPLLLLCGLAVGGVGVRDAFALEMSVVVKGGFSTLKVKAGTTFADDAGGGKDGGMGMELRPQINIDWKSFNGSLDFFYQGRVGSAYGAFPLNRVGAGMYYYPTGLPISTTILDSGVTVTQNRMSTFIMVQTMLATVAVTDTQNASGTVSFNGTTVGWQSGSGVEIPIGQNWSMVLEGAVEGTLIGASASAGTSNAALSVSAFSMLMGVAIRP